MRRFRVPRMLVVVHLPGTVQFGVRVRMVAAGTVVAMHVLMRVHVVVGMGVRMRMRVMQIAVPVPVIVRMRVLVLVAMLVAMRVRRAAAAGFVGHVLTPSLAVPATLLQAAGGGKVCARHGLGPGRRHSCGRTCTCSCPSPCECAGVKLTITMFRLPWRTPRSAATRSAKRRTRFAWPRRITVSMQ